MKRKFNLISALASALLLMTACNAPAELTTENPPIIPMPAEVSYSEGNFNLKGSSIQKDERTGKFADLLEKGIQKICGTCLEEKDGGNILLSLNAEADLPEEGYRLVVSTEGMKLEAKAEAGLFYGIQTLLQMTGKDGRVPTCEMKDYPAFAYRGLHLDVSRHFMSTDYIKSLLEIMSEYKLNRFHWHLVDGGGWRFESKKYPLLTQKAQARMESDWDTWWSGGDLSFVETGTPESYGGFYTQEEMKEIVAFAAERYITVIPEIEMPGHSNEVFFAYPQLTCKGETGRSEYCIGNPEVFEFLYGILDEVMEIFPSKYIHIGGDETYKEVWKTCPKCQALMKREGLEEVDELQSWCISTVEKYLNSKGRNIIGWDEILQGGLAPNATVMSWRGEDGGKTAAKMKHNVIMTPGKPLYFDHYQASPIIEPKAIGGYNPLEKVYAYNPLPEDLTEEDHHYILGAQANLWTEYVPDERHAQYMTWPRAIALAEALWTPVEQKDYGNFLLRANIHTNRLIERGVNAFPLRNIDIQSEVDTVRKEIRVRVKKENLLAQLRYTTDGSQPTCKSPICDTVITVKDSAKIRLQLYKGKEALTDAISYDTDWHKGIGKEAIYHCRYYRDYAAGGKTALTDGKRGGWTYLDGLWQGFTQPMDITIDLGRIQPLHRISAKFMQVKGAWVYTPGTVEVLLSDDGENFHSIGTRQTAISLEDSEIRFEIQKFNTSESARYVRMKATQSATKEGTFIFTDEIIIF